MIRLREDFSQKLEQPSSTRTSLYDPQEFVVENSAPEEVNAKHVLRHQSLFVGAVDSQFSEYIE